MLEKRSKARTNFLKLELAMDCLSVYNGVLKDPPIRRALDLITTLNQDTANIHTQARAYSAMYRSLIKENCLMSWSEYVIHAVLRDANPFTRAVSSVSRHRLSRASHQPCGQQRSGDGESQLAPSVVEDLNTLQQLAQLNPTDIKELLRAEAIQTSQEWALSIITKLPEWPVLPFNKSGGTRKRRKAHSPHAVCDLLLTALPHENGWSGCYNDLRDFHRVNGYGEMPFAYSFSWSDSHLRPILTPDPITLNCLLDYDGMIAKVVDNTKLFLDGKSAENVLLYGARGTGKSSTVKAVGNEFGARGLRIVEVKKRDLGELPELLDKLSDSRIKFIVFIDDLSFEAQGDEYNSLKSILEGGSAKQPANTLIYVTSNRRHIVVERFSDTQEDLFENDARHEKLSLAERFGLSLHFRTPLQKTYLEIVADIASKSKLDIDSDVLEREALTFANHIGSRSPRTARRFVRQIANEN